MFKWLFKKKGCAKHMNNKLEVIGIDHGLCGHNGSRYGTFFTPLSQISIGDEVMITDKNGQKHIYEVTETEVVNPYDNSIKTQGDRQQKIIPVGTNKSRL